MTIEVRRLLSDDWAVFREIRLRSLSDAPHAFGSTLAEANSRTEGDWRLLLARRAQFLAARDGRDVGTIGVVEKDVAGHAEVVSMWVDPRYRGTGVADHLVQTVIRWAREREFELLLLDVTGANTRAEKLYARHGFIRSGRRGVVSTNDPRPEFEMVLAMSPPNGPGGYPRIRWSDHDRGEYLRTVRTGPCFICEIVSGRSEYRHHEVYRDEYHIVFLNRYPTLYGQLLVAPTAHREDIIEDFTEFEYLRLQGLVHRVSRAVALVVPTERVYIFSLGSKQGNAHVHWHLAPLPPGVPYDDQQLAAIDLETHGQLVIPETDQADLADRVSQALNKRSPS